MKKIRIFFIIIAFIIGNASDLLAHKEATHQYILQEAYKLLLIHFETTGFGVNWDEQANTWIGNYGEGQNHYPWEPKAMAGIWCEDQWDAIFHFGPLTGPFPTSDIYHQALVSSTHFWRPDYRDVETTLNTSSFNFITIPNALHKALMYTYGEDEGEDWEMKFFYSSYGYHLKSEPILELFNATQLYVKEKYGYDGELLGGGPFWKDFGDVSIGRTFCYNILGRIAHLLGDMSVPDHVHQDEHSPLSPDKYEIYMKDGIGNSKVTYWTAERIFEEKGDFINPYCSELVGMSPVEYLMTITAQISDHFASNRKDGNDLISDIFKSQYVIDEDINGINTVNTPGPTTIAEYDASDDDDLDAIRDATFPFVIRATAGLLYWFLMETHQLDPDYRCRQFGYLIGRTLSGHDYMFREQKISVIGHSYWGPTIIESTVKNVVFRASHEIHFGPGFEARSGCEVSAFIGQCSDYELYES